MDVAIEYVKDLETSQQEVVVPTITLRAVPIRWDTKMPIFASEGFLQTVSDEYGWIGGFDGEGELRCVQPYAIIHKFGFRMMRFPVEPFPIGSGTDEGEEQMFLDGLVDFGRSRRADLILPAANTALFRAFPKSAIAAPYGTFIAHLKEPEETLFHNIDRDHRRSIARAQKDHVQIKCGMEYAKVAHEMISKTLGAAGLRFKTWQRFQQILAGLDQSVRVLVAEHDGKIQACMVCPFSEHSAYSWYSSTIANPVRGSMHLLNWEAMRQFRAAGVQQFNFVGVRLAPARNSKQDGIRHFKRCFGGELIKGYMWKQPIRPLKFAAYCAGIRYLKGGDIVDIERQTHSH